ncbi:hypothetical protein BDY24DRAFT_378062 [Mrakia frigida]|uniref:zinc finger MYND domain-containing protein n=1 Tax=Mrakia frigida TaxID=29902 RepID=UPI003FCC2594
MVPSQSPHFQKAVELGHLLGLDGESPTYKELIQEPSLLIPAQNLFNRTMESGNSSMMEAGLMPDEVFITFAQLYLPTFLDAYRFALASFAQQTSKLDEGASSDKRHVDLYHSLLQIIIPKGPFGRDIREHDSAVGFVSDVVDFYAASIVASNDSDIVLLPGVISRAFLAMGSSRADRIIASISSSSLDILTQRDKENTATKEQMRSLYNVFMLQEILSILKRTKSVDALRKEWPSVAGHVPWFYCERLNSTIQLREECVVTGEMPFCAKCKTVRYCSKAHQKEHWKWHKKFCFEPAW